MVSQLSLNLMNGYGSDGSRRSGGTATASAATAMSGNRLRGGGGPSSSAGGSSTMRSTLKINVATAGGGSSGYSADGDQQALPRSATNTGAAAAAGGAGDLPPDCINLPSQSQSSNKRRKSEDGASASGASGGGGSGGEYSGEEADDTENTCDLLPVRVSKRVKLAERTFLASVVKKDLERGGLPVPLLRTDAPRSWPTKMGVDMSVVKHQYSHTIANKSPFLAPTFLKNSVYDNTALLLDLFQTCEPHYRMSPEALTTGTMNDKNSSTSSVTDSESEHNGSVAEEEAESTKEQPMVSMGEALSLSNQARVIALGVSPFMVVHVNAAFTRLTGLSSVRVLGKTFGELLDDPKLVSILETATQEYTQSLNSNIPLITTQEQVVLKVKSSSSMSFRKNQLPCMISVSPVGSSGEVTHLALELRVSDAAAAATTGRSTTTTTTTTVSPGVANPMGMTARSSPIQSSNMTGVTTAEARNIQMHLMG